MCKEERVFGESGFEKKKFRKVEVDAQVLLVEGEAEMNCRKAEVRRSKRRLARLGLLSLLTFLIVTLALQSQEARAEEVSIYSLSAQTKLPPRVEADKPFASWSIKHLGDKDQERRKEAVNGLLFQYGSNLRVLVEWTALHLSEIKEPESRIRFETDFNKAFEEADVSKFPEGTQGKEASKKAMKEFFNQIFKLVKEKPELLKNLKDKEKMEEFLKKAFNFSDEKIKDLLKTLGITDEDPADKEKKEKKEKERKEKEEKERREREAKPSEPPKEGTGPAVGTQAGATAAAPAAPPVVTAAQTPTTSSPVPGTTPANPSKVGEQTVDPRVAAALQGACGQSQLEAARQKEIDGLNQLFAEVRQVAALAGNTRNGNNKNEIADAAKLAITKALEDDRRNQDNFALPTQNTPPLPLANNNNGNNQQPSLASPIPDNNPVPNPGTPIQVQVPPPNFAMAPYQPSKAPLPELGDTDAIITDGSSLAETVKQNADGSRVMKLSDNADKRTIWKVRKEAADELNSIDAQITAAKAQQKRLTADLQTAKEYFTAQDQQKEQQLQQALQQAQQMAGGAGQQGAQLAIQQAQQLASQQGRQATSDELQQAGGQGQQTYAQAAQTLVQQAQLNYQAFINEKAQRDPNLKKIQKKIDALATTMNELNASRKAVKDEFEELDLRYQDARKADQQRLVKALTGGNNPYGSRPNTGMNQAPPMPPRTTMGQAANPRMMDTSQGSGQQRGPLSGWPSRTGSR